jgi:molecular chaperone HtpG
MARIEFPTPLRQLLEDSDLQAPIRAFADRAGEILADNKLPFFPDYTDHGTDHINRVLQSEVELIPRPVWEDSKKESYPRLLCDADAAVIIGATLLHDIAMHLRPDGFRELVGKDSRFQPLSWFKESHEGHSADRPWQELWENYVREARRFSDRDLTNIIGEESGRVWKFHDLPHDNGQWESNHCLIIGEFIRRHHARLAHEIAIYGFPGLPIGAGEGSFPAMGKEEGHALRRLADLIGLTARSHGTSLRICEAYLEASPLYPRTPKPMGTAVLYPMALLRVADYLQIDQQRAPAVLLQLRNPPSPISVREWQKHCAVQCIGAATDPRVKTVTVSTDLGLTLYLQLKDLLAGLQAEIDHSVAVLGEAYGNLQELGLNRLDLATLRIDSNLHDPAFRDSLPYVPNETGFTADPNLLTLLVEPLYGKEPSVGVRELMQNAVDAVCELEVWCAAHGVTIQSLELPEQDGDVLIEFIKRENGTWFLRVRDRGIGMRSDTIQNYFLRAGASFRRSAEWAKEFLDEKGHTRVIRAGRFGIGAFAVFLLGPSFRLQTRYAGDDKSMGYEIAASANSQLIEIRRIDDLPIGTIIELEISSESVAALKLEEKDYSGYGGLSGQIDWFCWDSPKVIKRVIRGPRPELLDHEFVSPIRITNLPPEWAVIRPEGFDAVYWTFEDAPLVSCNGMCVRNPLSRTHRHGLWWSEDKLWWPDEAQLECPKIAVLDSAANLPLTIQRYGLSRSTLPFIDELTRDAMFSFIAYALICGPTSRAKALSVRSSRHPLQPRPCSTYQDSMDPFEHPFSEGLLRWCATTAAFVPADAWLYSLLNAEACLVFGNLEFETHYALLGLPFAQPSLPGNTQSTGIAILQWQGALESDAEYRREFEGEHWPAKILAQLCRRGVVAMGHDVEASRVLVSSDNSFDFRCHLAERRVRAHGSETESAIWREIPESARGGHFEAVTGSLTASIPLEPLLEAMNTDPHRHGVRFVAEIKTRRVERVPESLIARIWNECLGARAIPFTSVARKALIAEGSKHLELKRHIGAWQNMKRAKSKWATSGPR